MNEFYTSSAGPIDGTPDSAFTKSFQTIPDGTKSYAKITQFVYSESGNKKLYEITWALAKGPFSGRLVTQKLHCFDKDEKKKCRALNMMLLIYKMFNAKPLTDMPPTDDELRIFLGKVAGIIIMEWSAPKDDGTMMSGNWVSEVHPVDGFVEEVGTKLEVVHKAPQQSAPYQGIPPIGAAPNQADIPF